MATKALITGITGQDGSYLAEQLVDAGSEVWGLTRTGQLPPSLAMAHAAPAADIRDQAALERVIAAVQPDEVYHLAAISAVGPSGDDPATTSDVTGLGTARLLEAVRRERPSARVVVASSSAVFGEPDHTPQTESTPLRPTTPYGAAKTFAHHTANIYRQQHGLFVAVAILYNHESPRRPASIVSRKIIQGAVAVARGEQTSLALGNLDSVRDWGFAPDYTRAMQLMLAQSEPNEYVIATGRGHQVRDWCELAFDAVGLDYQAHVTSDPDAWRPAEPVPLIGDSSRARQRLGWTPSRSFQGLVELMLEAELAESGQA